MKSLKSENPMRHEARGLRPNNPLLSAFCPWCERRFSLRRTGGKPQRFCSERCRRAEEWAVRGWAQHQLAAGRVTIAEIKRGRCRRGIWRSGMLTCHGPDRSLRPGSHCHFSIERLEPAPRNRMRARSLAGTRGTRFWHRSSGISPAAPGNARYRPF